MPLQSDAELLQAYINLWNMQSLEAIAFFHRDKNNEGGAFRRLQNPNTGRRLGNLDSNNPLEIRTNLNLKDGYQYFIKCKPDHLSNREQDNQSNRLILDTSFEVNEIDSDAKNLVEKWARQYESVEGIAAEALEGLLQVATNDVDKLPETFLYELLQNADDYPPVNNHQSVIIHLDDNHLSFSHNGIAFTPANAYALCSVNAGDKRMEMDKTGFKGIGFKSLFTKADLIYINSGDFKFRFDKNYQLSRNNSAWQLIPIWCDDIPQNQDIPTESIHKQVSIIMRIIPEWKEIVKLALTKISKEPRLLLFLRNVAKITIINEGDSTIVQIAKEMWQRSEHFIIEIPNNTKQSLLLESRQNPGRIPEKLLITSTASIQFAGFKLNGQSVPLKDAQLFVYLPTDQRLGFPFLLNGDFIPDSSRQKIYGRSDWNQFLFEKAGYHLFVWIKKRLQRDQDNLALNLIPDIKALQETETDQEKLFLLQAFEKGMHYALHEVPFLLNRHSKVVCAAEILIDEIKILDCFNPEELEPLFDQNQTFINPNILQWEILVKLKRKGLGSINIISIETLKVLIETNYLKTWLKNPVNQRRFHKYCNDNLLHSILAESSIFLGSDGILYRAGQIYNNLGGNEDDLKWLKIAVLHPELNNDENILEGGPIRWDLLKFLESITKERFGELNEHLKNVENNKLFFHFLIKNTIAIPASLFNQGKVNLRYLWVVKINQTHLVNNSLNLGNIYSANHQLEGLYSANIIPIDNIHILDTIYHYPDTTESLRLSFFISYGIKNSEETTNKLFIAEHILKNSEIIAENLKVIGRISKDGLLLHIKTLWEFFADLWQNTTKEQQLKIKPNIKNLPVITRKGIIKPISQVFLGSHYTADKSLEELSSAFPEIDIEFISEIFISSKRPALWWKSFFNQMPVMKDTIELLELRIWPNINTISPNQLPGVTYQILKHAKAFKEKGIELETLPILLENNSIDYLNTGIIGKEYLAENLEDKIFAHLRISTKISAAYLNFGKKSEWIDFFREIGYPMLDTIEKVAVHKILEYKNQKVTDFDFKRNRDILVEFYNYKELDENLTNLMKNIQVKTLSEILPACECFLSSAYFPKIDLEDIAEFEKIDYISPEYLEDTRLNESQWRELFKLMDVKDDITLKKSIIMKRLKIPNNYKTFIDETYPNIKLSALATKEDGHHFRPFISSKYIQCLGYIEVSEYFWNSLKEASKRREAICEKIVYHWPGGQINVINYVHWYLINHKCLKNNAGSLSKPSELYTKSLYDPLIKDGIFTSPDLSGIPMGETTLEEFFKIKTKVDFFLAVSLLINRSAQWRRKENWDLIKTGLANRNILKSHENEIWSRFCMLEQMPDKTGSWVNKDQLFVLDSDLPPDIAVNHENHLYYQLRPFAAELGIKVLTRDNFNLNLPEQIEDNEFISHLKVRLKYFAFLSVEGSESWLETNDYLDNVIDLLACIEVKRIEWICNKVVPNISFSDQHYHFDEGIHYHVGRWNSMRASAFQGAIYNTLGFGKTLLRKETYFDFLEMTEQEIINSLIEAGYNVPDDWISKQVEDKDNNTTQKEPKDPPSAPQGEGQKGPSNLGSGGSGKIQEPKTFTGSVESELTAAEVAEIKSLLGQSLSDDDMENAWLIAFFRAIKWYKENGYDTSQPEKDYNTAKKNKFMVVVAPDEEKAIHRILVRSARNGILRLKYNAWFDLMDSNTELFVLTGNKPGQHKIFKTQKELLHSNKDSIVTKLDAADKYEELESLLSGEYKEDRKKFSEFSLMFRMKGFNGFQSIFESIYQKEGPNDFNEDDLDLG